MAELAQYEPSQFVSVTVEGGRRKIDMEELYAAYPEAVRLAPGFAPVGPTRMVAEKALLDGSYMLPLGPGYKVGDTVRVAAGGRTLDLDLHVMFGDRALVKSDVPLGEVVLKGRKIPDVKSVDSEQLLLAAISMINRAHQEIDDLRAKNTILEERVKALEGAPAPKPRAAKK